MKAFSPLAKSKWKLSFQWVFVVGNNHVVWSKCDMVVGTVQVTVYFILQSNICGRNRPAICLVQQLRNPVRIQANTAILSNVLCHLKRLQVIRTPICASSERLFLVVQHICVQDINSKQVWKAEQKRTILEERAFPMGSPLCQLLSSILGFLWRFPVKEINKIHSHH